MKKAGVKGGKKRGKPAKTKWNRDEIVRRITVLHKLDEDLTYSHIKEIDSTLVGAAISYFGNWGAAIRAVGLDYSEIRKLSKSRREEKVRKWTMDKVLEEIREIAKNEDDLSYAFMKEKHSSLVAAAGNYVGSWKKALELCGFDYAEVLKKGRGKRLDREKSWYRSLLLDRLEKLGTLDERTAVSKYPKFHKMVIDYFSSWGKAVKTIKSRKAGKD
jgi:hypothetical protein